PEPRSANEVASLSFPQSGLLAAIRRICHPGLERSQTAEQNQVVERQHGKLQSPPLLGHALSMHRYRLLKYGPLRTRPEGISKRKGDLLTDICLFIRPVTLRCLCHVGPSHPPLLAGEWRAGRAGHPAVEYRC